MNGAETYDLAQRGVAHLRSLWLRRSFAAFGPRSVIVGPLRLVGAPHIHIGTRVYIGSGCWLQGNIDEPEVPSSASVTLHIGDRVSMSGFTTISAARSVMIGNNVLIARGVFIADHTHKMVEDRPIRDQGITQIAPVAIGDGAWLGQNSVIMPGVKVGSRAVVGANSVVTKDVPSRTLALGAPARIIRDLPRRSE